MFGLHGLGVGHRDLGFDGAHRHGERVDFGSIANRHIGRRHTGSLFEHGFFVPEDFPGSDVGSGGGLCRFHKNQLFAVRQGADLLRQQQRSGLFAVTVCLTSSTDFMLLSVQRLVMDAHRGVAQARAVLLGQLDIAGAVDDFDVKGLHDAVASLPAIRALAA
ncbi:hypothetical protein ALP34_200052 [Pseudomonas savastanoi pv. glycinea]|nr:hypothetical protein ALP34_200052 [Pseudomonas savastanoi pv. glycinea]RMU16857.1 hypothetical protein ALP35_200050 [Pseudomonas savastanoi pv. glycinea]